MSSGCFANMCPTTKPTAAHDQPPALLPAVLADRGMGGGILVSTKAKPTAGLWTLRDPTGSHAALLPLYHKAARTVDVLFAATAGRWPYGCCRVAAAHVACTASAPGSLPSELTLADAFAIPAPPPYLDKQRWPPF